MGAPSVAFATHKISFPAAGPSRRRRRSLRGRADSYDPHKLAQRERERERELAKKEFFFFFSFLRAWWTITRTRSHNSSRQTRIFPFYKVLFSKWTSFFFFFFSGATRLDLRAEAKEVPRKRAWRFTACADGKSCNGFLRSLSAPPPTRLGCQRADIFTTSAAEYRASLFSRLIKT